MAAEVKSEEPNLEALLATSPPTTGNLSGEVPNLETLLSTEYVRNPLLQPTNKTAEQIVAEIMSEVTDDGVVTSLNKMSELHNELETKIKNYQATFDEQMKSIQEDIDKYWQIDKEYEKYHKRLDELCAQREGEKPASQQIRDMMAAFKEGRYKEGLDMVTAGERDHQQVDAAMKGEAVLPSPNQNGNHGDGEEVFSDAASDISDISTSSDKQKKDPSKAKSPRPKTVENNAGGKKTTKKKAAKT